MPIFTIHLQIEIEAVDQGIHETVCFCEQVAGVDQHDGMSR
jgi:hypothetical protein